MQADERLVALIREGHDRAFEVLFNRYQPRLLAFCRRLVGSPQDAEDVLQEVFTVAHSAILADRRPIKARPWLYRIARNRCVNHLRKRKPTADGVDSMDVHPHENGISTLERVQRREELRAIVSDVHGLPETQRKALTLRAVDDLSYTDIAQTMGTTLPSVKSLLVRARMSLAQSSAARGALAPFGLLALLRKLLPAKLGGSSGAGGSAGTAGSAGMVGSAGSAAGTASGVAATAGSVAAAGTSSVTLGGVVSAASTAATGIGGALGAKAAVGVATAAILAAGAVGVERMNLDSQSETSRPGRVGAAASETTPGTGSSITSPQAGVRGAADTAPGSTVRARSGRGRGAKAGKSSLEHLPHAGRPAGPAPGRIHAAQVSAATGASASAPGISNTPAASNGAGALVKPPKSAAPPSPGRGHVVDASHVQSPGLTRQHPSPPKPPPTPRAPR